MYGIPEDVDLGFLIGTEVLQICIGKWDVQIHLFDGVGITIESAFQHLPEGNTIRVEPSTARQATTLVSLLGASISQVSRESDKVLAMHFSNGDTLRIIDDSPQYEAFHIGWRDRLIVV
jgi:hypothetical protein